MAKRIQHVELFGGCPTFPMHKGMTAYAANVNGGDSNEVETCRCDRLIQEAGDPHYITVQTVTVCDACGSESETVELSGGWTYCQPCRRGAFESRLDDMRATGYGLAELCRVLDDFQTMPDLSDPDVLYVDIPKPRAFRLVEVSESDGFWHDGIAIQYTAPCGTQALIGDWDFAPFKTGQRYRHTTTDDDGFETTRDALRTLYLIHDADGSYSQPTMANLIDCLEREGATRREK